MILQALAIPSPCRLDTWGVITKKLDTNCLLQSLFPNFYFLYALVELMNDVFEHWEPKHQAWIINKSYIISSGAAALPGLILSIKFR